MPPVATASSPSSRMLLEKYLAMCEANWLGEAPDGMWRASSGGPDPFDGVVELALGRWHEPLLTELNRYPIDPHRQTQRGVTVVGDKRVEIDEVADAIGDVLEGAGHDESAVRETDEHDRREVLVQNVVHDVADVRRQRHLRAREMHPFTNAGEARREHLMPCRVQLSSNAPKHMSTAPPTVH